MRIKVYICLYETNATYEDLHNANKSLYSFIFLIYSLNTMAHEVPRTNKAL